MHPRLLPDAECARAIDVAGPRDPPSAKERRVLSRFEYDDGRVEYIEPLTGMARHPFAKWTSFFETPDVRSP